MSTSSVRFFTLEKDEIDAFLQLTGDCNKLFTDEKFVVSETQWDKLLAPQFLLTSLISACLTDALGDGSIFIHLDLSFIRPTYVGDMIAIEVVDNVVAGNEATVRDVTVFIYTVDPITRKPIRNVGGGTITAKPGNRRKNDNDATR